MGLQFKESGELLLADGGTALADECCCSAASESDCNDCDPPLHGTYALTVSGLPAPYDYYNGTYTLTAEADVDCSWIKRSQEIGRNQYEFQLIWATGWVVFAAFLMYEEPEPYPSCGPMPIGKSSGMMEMCEPTGVYDDVQGSWSCQGEVMAVIS
jgi:hypothetical protein